MAAHAVGFFMRQRIAGFPPVGEFERLVLAVRVRSLATGRQRQPCEAEQATCERKQQQPADHRSQMPLVADSEDPCRRVEIEPNPRGRPEQGGPGRRLVTHRYIMTW